MGAKREREHAFLCDRGSHQYAHNTLSWYSLVEMVCTRAGDASGLQEPNITVMLSVVML